MHKLLISTTTTNYNNMDITSSKICVYANCFEQMKPNQTNTFYKFPIKNKNHMVKWQRNCGNPKVTKMKPSELNRKHICDRHFQPGDYTYKNQGKVLKKSSVPIPYLGEPLKCTDDANYKIDHVKVEMDESNHSEMADSPISLTLNLTETEDLELSESPDEDVKQPNQPEFDQVVIKQETNELLDVDDHPLLVLITDDQDKYSLRINPIFSKTNGKVVEVEIEPDPDLAFNNNNTNGSAVPNEKTDWTDYNTTNCDYSSTTSNKQGIFNSQKSTRVLPSDGELYLLMKIEKLNTKIADLEAKLKHEKIQVNKLIKKKQYSPVEIIDNAIDKQSEFVKTFVLMQIFERNTNTIWTIEQRDLALMLYKKSALAYRFMLTDLKFLLPSVKTIQSWLNEEEEARMKVEMSDSADED